MAGAWRVDWAGRHGAVWGTVNAGLTVITLTWTGHCLVGWWPTTTVVTQLVAGLIALAGVVGVLLRAAFLRVRPAGAMVAYTIACWIGAGTWSIMALHSPVWSVRRSVIFVVALVVLAGLAGSLAALAASSASDDGDEQTPDVDLVQASRDGLAAEWEQRIARVCSIEVTVPAIEQWARCAPDGRPVGRTVQASLPTGGASWRSIQRHQDDLAADLDLGPGCGVRVVMGATRRAALIEITEVNLLAEEQPYPEDYSPLSVYDPIPMMTAADGQTTGPTLREHCVGIFGEPGSGKSNAGQVIGAAIARMKDALLLDADCTGNRLSRDLLRPFLEGRTDRPAVFWAATDPHELWLMLRAVQRGMLARNNMYGDLCVEANDDKVPISRHIPALIVRGDEIMHFASKSPDDPGVVDMRDPRWRSVPTLHDLAKSVVTDDRAPGCRAVMLGLRAVNDIIAQDIQVHLHSIGVLRATLASEYRWAFGANPTCAPEDAPWPGCIQMRRSSTDAVAPYHVWRVKPQQLYDIGCVTAEYQPELDALTAMAMNGRDVNGRPFDDLYPGELDCLDTRWNRYFAKYNVKAAVPTPRAVECEEMKTVDEPMGMEEANDALRDAVEAVRRRVAESKKGGGEDEPEDGGAPVDPAAWAAALASWDTPSDWQTMAMGLIRQTGTAGAQPGLLRMELEKHGYRVSRDTLHVWLRAGADADPPRLVHQRHGRWAAAE